MICRRCRESSHPDGKPPKQCRGGTWCDCQHRPSPKPDQTPDCITADIPPTPLTSGFFGATSTVCVCGDPNAFVEHTNRRTGEPCPGLAVNL